MKEAQLPANDDLGEPFDRLTVIALLILVLFTIVNFAFLVGFKGFALSIETKAGVGLKGFISSLIFFTPSQLMVVAATLLMRRLCPMPTALSRVISFTPLAIGLIAITIYQLLLFKFIFHVRVYLDESTIIDGYRNWNWFLIGLTLSEGILSPIVEEALFRGAAWRRLRISMGTISTGLITSASWLALHLNFGLGKIVVLIVPAMILSWVRSRSKSFIEPTIVHIVMNFEAWLFLAYVVKKAQGVW